MSAANPNPPSTALAGPKPWYIAVIAGMASYLDAATIVSVRQRPGMYPEPLGLSGDQIGVLAFALTLGIAIGAAAGGRLGDQFGRKPVFSVTMIGIDDRHGVQRLRHGRRCSSAPSSAACAPEPTCPCGARRSPRRPPTATAASW